MRLHTPGCRRFDRPGDAFNQHVKMGKRAGNQPSSLIRPIDKNSYRAGLPAPTAAVKLRQAAQRPISAYTNLVVALFASILTDTKPQNLRRVPNRGLLMNDRLSVYCCSALAPAE